MALLQNGHVGDAVLLGQVVGRGDPVPAATDDHDVVFCPGRRITPLRLPIALSTQGLA